MFAMLFPKIADNNYLGPRLVVYIFIPFLLLMNNLINLNYYYIKYNLNNLDFLNINYKSYIYQLIKIPNTKNTPYYNFVVFIS